MARDLGDLAVVLGVMAGGGFDNRDNVTALAPAEVRNKDYGAALYGGGLGGLRFGVLNGFLNHTLSNETAPVNEIMASMVSRLTAAGARVINITEPVYDALAIAKLDVQAFEFREMLDAYLAATSTGGNSPSTFNELYDSGKFLVIPAQYQFIKRATLSSTADLAYRGILAKIQTLKRTLDDTFTANNLDAIIYPQQKNLVVKIGSPSQSGRNGILAALTGWPVVCVPAGFSPPSADAPLGVPVGMEILGRPWSEDRLLNMAKHISELVPVRRMPPFASGIAEPKCYERVPVVKPNVVATPAAYPLGIF